MSTGDSFSQGATGEPASLFCAANVMTEQRRIQAAARQREAYLASLVDIQRQLLSLKDALTPAHLEPLLASLGRVAQVSRIYYYDICSQADGPDIACQQVEWCVEGIPPTLAEAAFQAIPIDIVFPGWRNALLNDGMLSQTQAQFTPLQQQILSAPPSSVTSLLLLPVLVKGNLVGVIGLSDCLRPKVWEQAEIDLLGIAAAAISLTIERQQAEASLKEAEKKYRSIFEDAVEGIFQTTLDGTYKTVNPMLAKLYGYDSPSELIDSVTNIGHQLYVDPNRRQVFIQQMHQCGAVIGFESQVYRKDGSVIWISESARALYDRQGHLVGYEGTVEDITLRKRDEAEILRRDCLLRGVARASHYLLTTPELDQAITQVLETLGEAAETDRVYLYEHHPHPETGELSMSMRYEWTRPGILPSINQPHWQNLPYSQFGLSRWYAAFKAGQAIQGIVETFPQAEQSLLQRDGILSILMVPIWVDERLWGYIGFDACRQPQQWTAVEEAILVTIAASIGGAIKRQQTEAQMRHQAFHDALTGLPNRTLFNHHLPRAIDQARRADGLLGVIFLDLDRFKIINDTLGHAIGDQLLQQVTQRLNQAIRQQDLLARWGGMSSPWCWLIWRPQMMRRGSLSASPMC